ncbi:MAG: CHAT domain-containing protein [Candidatus Omnitrophota bacterium]
MVKDTNSLVLEILKQSDTLKMSLFEQKDIASTIRHYSQSLPFSQIQKLCSEVILILNKADKKNTLDSSSMYNLKKTGQLLWDHLLSKSVKNRLKAALNKDLVLSLDEELISIPWELLYDGEDFLCLKFNLGRVVRAKEQPSLVQYRGVRENLKMLILADPTNDLKSAYLEGIEIKNQFERKRKEIRIDFKGMRIDTLYVKKNLRDYDIVHFAGHCEYDRNDFKKNGWLLSDGRFTTQDILALGESLSLPSLVFSNACYSAEVKPDLMDADYQTKTYSLASAFLFSGVRHYIGTIRKVEDPISLVFAKEFYTRLINGDSVGQCMRQGRLKLIEEYGDNAIAWASYLLYGDTNFVLFKPQEKPEAVKTVRKPRFLNTPVITICLGIFILLLCVYLYFFLPTLNPNAYFLYLKAHKLFLAGKNQAAFSKAGEVIKNDPRLLEIYPLLAEISQRAGKRDDALKYYFDYAVYSGKKHDRKHLVSAYIGIGWVYQLTGDYPKALDFYNKALSAAREFKDVLNEAAALRKSALYCMDKEDYDKALELLMKSSEINRDRQYIYEHRYNLACDYFDIGLVFANKEDSKTAREFYQKSRVIFKKLKLNSELSDAYFNLGEMCLLDKQYQQALDYYLKGMELDRIYDNKPNLAADYGMIGELYAQMDNFSEAEKSFNQSIFISQQIDARLELASASYNLGLLYKEKGYRNKARECFRQAQEIYRNVDTPDFQRVKQALLDNASVE